MAFLPGCPDPAVQGADRRDQGCLPGRRIRRVSGASVSEGVGGRDVHPQPEVHGGYRRADQGLAGSGHHHGREVTMRRNAFAIVAGAVALAMLMGCSMVSPPASGPPKHPEELAARRVDCRECHENVSTGALKPYETFRHSLVFIREHSMYASQGQNLCLSCHGPPFCPTCHVRNEEGKRTTKRGDRPDRVLPPRGGYIVLHQIDGRLAPGACARGAGDKT